ncbi:hypothetical protein QVD17_05289 [Tagetes erecta]|uniref:RING-type E3 ubiquitin transferase n=1 Tax=Tagetes erecta TaxID=13708 RepID=A0AAD8PBD1_TARER|nr:hypothetical protein QVD17_05289 [Tagetes erecta]
MITIRKVCKPKDDCDNNDSSPSPQNHSPSTLKILTICFIVASFSLLCYYIIFKACRAFRTRRRNRITTTSEMINRNETHHDVIHQPSINQDHEPVVFHPIWLINTIGLDQSVIVSIKMFKYGTEDGVDSDCAVCLGMFQQDESLRLLPACRHAFHVVCIDTWLRSHTNCPLCRAPVLNNNTTHQVDRNSSTREEISSGTGSSNETTRLENGQEMDANGESSVKKLALISGVRVQSDLTQNCCQKLEPLRRSVSAGSFCFVDEESES